MSNFDTAKEESFPILDQEIQETADPAKKGWTPEHLEFKFWVPVLGVFAVLAIGLEIALNYSQKHQGWAIKTLSIHQVDALQYAYHFPPVVVAMVVIVLWAKINEEMLRLQPYVVLAQGASPAESSILLDYTREGKFAVWVVAAKKRHFLVSITSLLTLLLLVLNPVSSNIFVIGDVTVVQSGKKTTSMGTLGLNDNDPKFKDYTLFLTAAGFSGASVQYSLSDPPFTHNQWTVAPFSIPTGLNGNGTISVYTTAVKNGANCLNSDTMNTTRLPAGAGYTNAATWTHCNSSWDVDHGTPSEFEAFNAVCDDDSSVPPDFRRVVFWYFTSLPAPLVTAVFCSPSVELWEVAATLDLATSAITSVVPSKQVTDVPSITSLNGRGYNGVESEDFLQDYFSIQRQNATKVQLPAAVVQVASTSGVYDAQRFTNLTSMVYNMYLKTLAKHVYFISKNQTIDMQVATLEKRGKLDAPATHIAAAILIITAVVGTITLLQHRRARADLKLWHEPGTIAAAVAMGAGTDLGNMLRSPKADLGKELRGTMLMLDPITNKVIIVQNETQRV